MRKAGTAAVYVFIQPPSLDALQYRFEGSGMAAAEIKEFIDSARADMQIAHDHPDMFDAILTHGEAVEPGELPSSYMQLRAMVLAKFPLVFEKMNPPPLVLCGLEGVGKRTLVQALKAEFTSTFMRGDSSDVTGATETEAGAHEISLQSLRTRRRVHLATVSFAEVRRMREAGEEGKFVYIAPPSLAELKLRFERSSWCALPLSRPHTIEYSGVL